MNISSGPRTATSRDVAVDVAEMVASSTYQDLDDSNVVAVKKFVLDVLGAGVAGHREPGCRELRDLYIEMGGASQASLIGGGPRLPAPAAVAVNGTMCRALEFDDVSETALIHTTATVVPVALAAAEASDETIGGQRLITAIAVGMDVANRLSLAPVHTLDGDDYRPRGMSYTYQIGTFAGAATACNFWGLDRDTTLHALGLAYSQAAGNQQCLVDSALSVRVQQGLSAAAGLFAGLMARRGITGATSPLEGKFGYYPTYCNDMYDRDVILDDLGSRYTADTVSIKPYPCCKFTHTAICAALRARGDRVLTASDITRVVVHVDNREYYNVVCDPIEETRDPHSTVDAQFSLPYTVAVALLQGAPRLEDFTPELIREDERLSLAAKVDPRLGEVKYTERVLPTPGHVEVHLSDGSVLEGRCDYAPGHPNNAMSWQALERKFHDMVAFPEAPLLPELAEQFIGVCRKLEDVVDTGSLVSGYLNWSDA